MERIGLSLMFIGIFLILLGAIIMAFASFSQVSSNASGSIVIFIGPIPIVLGWGPYSPTLILISLIIVVLMILFVIFSMKSWRVKI